MKKFAYFKPENIDQAFEIADSYDWKISYLAGGTDLLVKMKNYCLSFGAVNSWISGSGPTVVSLCRNKKDANDLKNKIMSFTKNSQFVCDSKTLTEI